MSRPNNLRVGGLRMMMSFPRPNNLGVGGLRMMISLSTPDRLEVEVRPPGFGSKAGSERLYSVVLKGEALRATT